MGQVLRPESIGAVTKISNTALTIAASNVIIGGQQYSTGTITISTGTSGLNGIDTGTIASNRFYYVFIVKSGTAVGGVISLSTIPTGFSAYKLVGQCTTKTASTQLEAANAAAVDNVPIGHIVSSSLSESQFRAVHGAGWVLADGRSVVGSKYASITGLPSIDDLRGVVLRGKNNGRSAASGNADGDLPLGTYQGDVFSSHDHGGGNHSHTTYLMNFLPGGAGYLAYSPNNYDGQSNVPASGAIISTQGGSETRMRNVTVNHFIKIN